MNLRYYQPQPRVSGPTQQQDILELLTQDLTVRYSFIPTPGPSMVSINMDRGIISLGGGGSLRAITCVESLQPCQEVTLSYCFLGFLRNFLFLDSPCPENLTCDLCHNFQYGCAQ